MHASQVRLRPAIRLGAVLAVCGLTLALTSARADIVYLKDGTVLNGKVVTQKERISDSSSGLDFTVFKAGGFFAVTDGVRVVIFSTRNLDTARGDAGSDKTTFGEGWHEQVFRRDIPRPKSPTPPAGIFDPPELWKESGQRILNLRTPLGNVPVLQRLTYMSPYSFRIDAVDYNWVSNYLTSEMDPKLVRKLLIQFEKLKEKNGVAEPDKRMLIFRFFVQMKNYDMAEAELKLLQQDTPTAKERVDKARAELRLLKADQDLQDATMALGAGQIRLAQAYLSRIPKEGLDANLNISVNTLRVKIDTIFKQYESAYRFLRRLPGDANGPMAEILCEAAAGIRDEMFVEGMDRLEPFLSLAEQAARAKAQNRDPAQQPEELLSMAVTGWLLGKEQAETKPKVAGKLWKARRFALAFLATHDAKTRNHLLEQYQKDEPIEMEELARVLANLPAPEPATEPITFQPLRRQSRSISQRPTVKYDILPPSEYQPGRPYPLLVVLNHKGQKPEEILKGFGFHGIKNGYIIVAPDWSDVEGTYAYSVEEHYRVLDTIRDVKQRYNVDSDRVFLAGWGEGGNAAWDIGLSHPDLFAGVLPMSSQPNMSRTIPYWPNARNLPFYVITGELAGDAVKQIQKVVQEWVGKGFPAMHVIYMGRGVEWYVGELPFMFDWMNRKKRATCYQELGLPGVTREGSEAYQTMRRTDNRFYWISSENISDRYYYENKNTGMNAVPARIQASIKPGNSIQLYSVGLKDVTLSFSSGMIDFSKPVTVKSSSLRGEKFFTSKVPLKLDLAKMMDDLYERGDRRRPVLAQWLLVP